MKRIKKILASLMVAVMVLTAAPLSGFVGIDLPNLFDIFASAESYSGTCGDNLTWSLDTSTGELVISGEGEMDDYSSYSSAPWHSYRSSIKKVTIGDSVTSIGSTAFYNCTSLTSITIPDSVTSIGSSAFDNTGYYNNSSNWEKNVLYIGNHLIKANKNLSGAYTIKVGTNHVADAAFYNCTSLTSITIPESVTSIGSSAFSGCTSLASITIPDSVTSISYNVFYGCTSLTSITIPDGVTSIGDSAFYGCTSLTNITIPDSVKDIQRLALYNTGYYNNSSNWKDNVLYIGNNLIEAKTSLSGSYTIKSGTKCIADWAFAGCTSLTSVTIPDSITSLSDVMFLKCESLASVTIPESVTDIGDSAFDRCTSLSTIVLSDKLTRIGRGAFSNTGYYNDNSNWEDDVLYIGNYLIDAKTSLSGSCTIKEGTKCIADAVFEKCTSLTNITIPDGVTSIGFSTFRDCTSLTSITIPDSVTSIGRFTFNNCTNLTDVYYTGTQEQWNSIAIGSSNDPLTSATIHFIQTGKCGDNLTWSLDTTTGELVISGTGEMKDYSYSSKAPWYSYRSSIKKLTICDGVTSISSEAFYDCDRLTSITIPDSVTSIGAYAFSGCTRLTSITIPDSVTNIGSDAFLGCTSLTSIVIPDSVTSIGDDSFHRCTSLTSITIPDSVTSIGSEAFYGCTSLTSITIPDSVTSISSEAFYLCTSLTSITIPDSVTSIGSAAFACCDDLTSITIGKNNTAYSSDENGALFNKDKTELIQYPIGNERTSYTIPDSVTSIGDFAFAQCRNLTSITIPDSVRSIGSYAFCYCTSLTSVTIPDSVTSIGSYAFSFCISLTSITIPDSVTSIGDFAFDYCTNLTSITIPDSVTSIGDFAFDYCTNLTSITIPDSVTSIGYDAFYGCTSLTSITIPDSVTSIGGGAFYNTGYYNDSSNWEDDVLYIGNHLIDAKESLSGVYAIKDGTKCIADDVFEKCTSLTSITIPDSVTSIGSSAFYNCTGLTDVYYTGTVAEWCAIIFTSTFSIPMYYAKNLYINGTLVKGDLVIPDSVTSIGDYAFYDCDSLTSITIPDSVTSIGDFAFYNCTGLTSVTIPDSVTSIGSSVFNNCTSLTSITIPEGMTNISSNAFKDCTSLTSITIPDSVTSIGSYAFYNTGYYNDSSNWEDDVLYIGNHLIDANTSISGAYTIKEGTKCIGTWAFYGCESLESITVPDSVTSINFGAFQNCTSLESVTIPDGVTSIDKQTFLGCTGLTSITIPDSVTSIGNNAFYKCTSLTIVHYTGTQTQWNGISKGSVNDTFTKTDIHFCEKREGTPATCENDGYTEGVYCSVCDKYISGHETIPTLGHDYQEVVEQSSCTASGLKYKKCSRCESVIDRETIPALGHNPEYFKVDPTCKEAGYECYKCTNCGTEYMREELDIIDHIAGDWETVETATCSEDGYKIKKCTMCGEETHRETIPATGHSYEESIVTEPTCEGVGTKRFTCSVCGDSYDEEIAANGHKIKVIRKEPTCTSLGNEQSQCEVCGNMIGEMIFIPKLPHDYTEEVIAEPTCVKDGTKRYTCSSCGDSYDETIPATGEHKLQTIRKEPTCTSIGNEQYLCETCGNMIGDMVFLPKLPHTYGEWTVTDPTATEDGSKVHSCTACGKTESVAIPAIGFETAEGVTVDFEKNIISGFNAGETSLDGYTTTVNENYVWEYESANGKLGTGSKAILKDGDTVVAEYTILIFGDTTGDSWYDGTDAVLVSCLANGMLTKEDVGEAVYMAADCNHDGVIDEADVALLNEAGALLSNVDQTKPAEVLLETSAEYVEYLDLIDQSPEIETEDETDIPEVDVETEETPEADTEDAKIDIFGMIMNFIKTIFEMLLSYIPMPIK